MTKIRDLPLLAILPSDKLLLHEQHDQQRSPGLLDSLRTSGMLRNPPIVAPLHDRTGRYMVLDGAHRVQALEQSGLRHVLVQVVEPDDPGLALNPWNHVVWEMDSVEFIESIRAIPILDVQSCDDEQAEHDILTRHGVAIVKIAPGVTFIAHPPSADLITQVNFMNAIVDRYKERGRMDRTSIQDAGTLTKLYPYFSGLVIFPRFRIEDILYLAGAGYMLPTGTTRFAISPRALHVNYPLERMAADVSLEEKNAVLQRWMQERLNNKGVRYYAEATFLFDE